MIMGYFLTSTLSLCVSSTPKILQVPTERSGHKCQGETHEGALCCDGAIAVVGVAADLAVVLRPLFAFCEEVSYLALDPCCTSSRNNCRV